MHVLVVEDDARLAEALARILEDNGYTTDVVHDGEAGVRYGETGTYDVIILDVMLPKADGFTVAQRLRRAHVGTPILLLTARDAISDKICGYDSGADDYMTKPFEAQEDLTCGDESIRLSQKEFAIARILLGSPGAVLSKEQLISRAWGPSSSASDNNVEAYISFLRKKMAHVGSKAKIETIRSVGYRLAEEG